MFQRHVRFLFVTNLTDFSQVIKHYKKRLFPFHPLSPDAVRTILAAPGGHYNALGPLFTKRHSGLKTVPMDLYATFTTGYLFLPQDPILKPGGHQQATQKILPSLTKAGTSGQTPQSIS